MRARQSYLTQKTHMLDSPCYISEHGSFRPLAKRMPMPARHALKPGFRCPTNVVSAPWESRSTVLVDEHTGLQRLRITRHPIFGAQLFLDGDLQISESDAAYGIAMVSPLLGLSQLSRVGILGGGDGGVLRELLRCLPAQTTLDAITMVEIDARVIALCRTHLPGVCEDAFKSSRAQVIVGDAFAWIAAERELDAVIYDLTMDPVREGQSRETFIAEIIGNIARALRPGGVFSMQCCGHGRLDAGDRMARRQLLPLIRSAVDTHFTDRVEQDVLVPSYRDLWTFLSARRPYS